MKPRADVIYTGHMRTFKDCVHSQRWHVLRHFDCTFYVSTVRDEQAESYKLLHELFPECPVHVETVNEQPTVPEPVEPVRFEPYARSVSVQAVLRQLWQLERGWHLRQNALGDAPTVIRIRPDIFFHSCKQFLPFYQGSYYDALCLTPYWGRFGGCNDRFAIMGKDAAPHYFQTFSRIPMLMEAGCPLHPESLVKASVEFGGGMMQTDMLTEFTTMRLDGDHRAPEVSVFDLAALRG